MRTIDEIKEGIAADFMRNEVAADLFGFPAGSNFGAHFSNVSIINVLFYIFSCAVWTLEKLFDAHTQEVEARIAEILPHRREWYKRKTLEFMLDKELIPDADQYDTADMTPEQIEAAHVVRYATADESKNASILTIKVAGENGGTRCKLDEQTQTQLAAYLAEIKDAGVHINLVNKDPDTFNCLVDIYYNPMLLPENVRTSCEAVVRSYIENLPFNGEYTNMTLIDRLQEVEGVKIAEFRQATYSTSDVNTVAAIDARCTPSAGYFIAGEVSFNMKSYEQV